MLRNIFAVATITALAACSDPTAVQQFSQQTPPAATFHQLLVYHANLPLQKQELANIISTDASTPNETAAQTALSNQSCGQIPVLDQMHASMIAYMSALGSLATSGSASAAQATAGVAPASGLVSPQGLCVAPLPATAPAATDAKAGGAAPAAPSLTANLQAFAKAFQNGNAISQDQAGAAGSLAQLLIDLTTSALREQALHKALGEPYRTAFLSAVGIETTVIAYGLDGGTAHHDDLSDYTDTLADVEKLIDRLNAAGKPAAAQKTAGLLWASWRGKVLPPDQAANLRTQAAAYLTALAALTKAYTALSDSAASGNNLLTASTLTTIQPLLNDLGNAYSALTKL